MAVGTIQFNFHFAGESRKEITCPRPKLITTRTEVFQPTRDSASHTQRVPWTPSYDSANSLPVQLHGQEVFCQKKIHCHCRKHFNTFFCPSSSFRCQLKRKIFTLWIWDVILSWPKLHTEPYSCCGSEEALGPWAS